MNKQCNSDITSGCIMQFIKHFHCLNTLLTWIHYNKYWYLTFRTETCLAFLTFCPESVDRSLPVLKGCWILFKLSRSSELKNFICLLSPVLAHINSPRDCTIQKSNSQSWDDPKCLVLFVNNIINKRQIILSRRTGKEKIIELSWCQKYYRTCDFLKMKTKNSLFKLRH